nr:TonB-dependent siderophore receptor [Vibrio anguillarum]
MTHQVATCHKKQSFSGKPTLSRIALLVALQISASALPISITHAEEQADESITVYGQANEAYAAGKISKASSIGMLGDKDFLDTPFNAIGY